ncbi:hypothetical protein E2P81_ATG05781 [Venturia nashicola]|uniref:Uncharacterized protein n=1 Tax=Venturia nashicola TaxID=86259 RepID=A0A4Z1NV16_9PEZI|nr:hypothetical protein E6O75_ATG05925 [Venturia nashicola]TLD29487.1 hypothetical protein E2P81_ATG05781 [Venturia nashicola]
MDLKARVKKYASPGRSKDKASRDAKEKAKSDDENDSDKKSIFSTSTKSPVRVFIRDQLHRKISSSGPPRNSVSGARVTSNGFTPKRFSEVKTPIEASPLTGNEAPPVPAKDTSSTLSSLTEMKVPSEPFSPVSTENSKIETAVAVKLENLSPEPSPGTLTPETAESHADSKETNQTPVASTEPKTPVSFPKRSSSLVQSGQTARPVTITESLSEDENRVEDRKDSAQDSDETSVQNGEEAVSTDSTEKETKDDAAGGVETVVKRKGKVDELLITAFLILLLVFIFYNPLFDVPNIKLPTIKAFV